MSVPAVGSGYDLTKLNKDQYMQFRCVFVEECNYHDVFVKNGDQKAIRMLLSALCMIMCKKVPEGVVTFKIEDLHKKIKLLPLPRTYGFETMPGMQK